MKLSCAFPLFSFPLALVVAIPVPPVVRLSKTAGTSSTTPFQFPPNNGQPNGPLAHMLALFPELKGVGPRLPLLEHRPIHPVPDVVVNSQPNDPSAHIHPVHDVVEPLPHDQFPPNNVVNFQPNDPLAHMRTFHPKFNGIGPSPLFREHIDPYHNVLTVAEQIAQQRKHKHDVQSGPSSLPDYIKIGAVLSLLSETKYGYKISGYGDNRFNTVFVVDGPYWPNNRFLVAKTFGDNRKDSNIVPATEYCNVKNLQGRRVQINDFIWATPDRMVENPLLELAEFDIKRFLADRSE